MFDIDKVAKTRVDKDCNYKSIYFNGKTVRMKLEDGPMKPLVHPEFYDISITRYCEGACNYCYQDSTIKGKPADNILEKIENYFSKMTENQKPFQVAIGGGEPTSHPQFTEILKLFKSLGISPNYTTNGMWVMNDEIRRSIIGATKQHSEGVALTCHEHLQGYWSACALTLVEEGIFTNFHNMISDKESVDKFIYTFSVWRNKIKYFLLLPVIDQGRCDFHETNLAWEYLFSSLEGLDDVSQISFGANFYPYLSLNNSYWAKKFNIVLYEPEMFSKYIDFVTMESYTSSFSNEKWIDIK